MCATEAGVAVATMRVLVMVDKRLPSDHSFIEGVLATELPRRSVDVVFLGLAAGAAPPPRAPWVRYLIAKPWPGGMVGEALQMLITFPWRMLREGRFDAVFTRNDPMALFLGWVYRIFGNRRARHVHQISTLHAEAILQSPHASPSQRVAARGALLVRRLFLHRTSHVLAISEDMQRFLERKYPRLSDRISYIPLGILAEDFADPVPYGARKTDVIYIGTLAASRRLEVVIDAIEHYNKTYGALGIEVWGRSHTERDDILLREYVRRRGLAEKVVFYGQAPRHLVLQALKSSRLGLCTIPPEKWFRQSSPTKLVEYLASGCCVVAARGIPDQDRVVEASGGGLLVEFTPEGMAAGIHRLLSDPQLAERMGEQGRQYVMRTREYRGMTSDLVRLLEGPMSRNE